MNLKQIRRWTGWSALALLPLALLCGRLVANSASGTAATNNVGTTAPAPATSDVPPPDAAQLALENAEVSFVSTARPPESNLSSPAMEIVKLAQAGVDEGVMLSYVTNSTYIFGLTSDDIIYLNDIGVPPSVVTAMIQRDQSLKGASSETQVASAPPVYTNNTLVPAPGAPTPYSAYSADQTIESAEETASAATVIEAPAQPQVNVSYTYFYDSLAPYGNWVYVNGYGLCWQPTVVVVNRDWTPYVDSGRWVYTEYGWYWASDYSWGWAPFHYGRWFRHSRLGWCWAPDTVWGPAWVSWRYTPNYCGWAPLPPTACYRPGWGFTYYGSSVSSGFSFGLSFSHYTFVPTSRFCDRNPRHHRLPRHQVTHVYNNSVVINQNIRGRNNTIINEGVPVTEVAAATRREIRPIRIRDAEDPQRARAERRGGNNDDVLAVYRPNLPQPERPARLVGEGVRPAAGRTIPAHLEGSIVRNNNRNAVHSVRDGATSESALSENITRRERRAADREQNNLATPVRSEPRPESVARDGHNNLPQRGGPLVLRGANRTENQRERNRQDVLSEGQPHSPAVTVPQAPAGSSVAIAPERSDRIRERQNDAERHVPAQTQQIGAAQPNRRVFQPGNPGASQMERPSAIVNRPDQGRNEQRRQQQAAPLILHGRQFSPAPQPQPVAPSHREVTRQNPGANPFEAPVRQPQVASPVLRQPQAASPVVQQPQAVSPVVRQPQVASPVGQQSRNHEIRQSQVVIPRQQFVPTAPAPRFAEPQHVPRAPQAFERQNPGHDRMHSVPAAPRFDARQAPSMPAAAPQVSAPARNRDGGGGGGRGDNSRRNR